jgi:DNA invertase Pin-like site-specific DNA recombinase
MGCSSDSSIIVFSFFQTLVLAAKVIATNFAGRAINWPTTTVTRLARNVHFVSGLQESKVDFVACDNPHANKLTINIMASIGEHEAEMISLRTKAALQAAKDRGQLLGSARPGHWDGREDVRLAAVSKAQKVAKAKRNEEAAPIYDIVKPIIAKMKEDGYSLQAIADKLNEDGFTTLRGAQWNKVQVSRLVA